MRAVEGIPIRIVEQAYGTPLRRFATDRRCATKGCITILSTYNRNKHCRVHTQPTKRVK